MKHRAPFVTAIMTTLAAALPIAASAHVKWFAEKEVAIEPFDVTESAVVVWIFIIAAIVLCGFFLDKRFTPKGRNRKRWSASISRLFQAMVGLWLIISSIDNSIIAPVFPVSDIVTQVIRGGLLVAGILFITGFFVRIASLLLMAGYIATAWQFGILELLEHAHVFGIGLAIFIQDGGTKNPLHRFAGYSVTAIRVTAGISFITLALSEKLFHPGLSAAFLTEHNWNFMELYGFDWFSDRLFILSAGMTELLLGTLLFTGILVRPTLVAIAVVFGITATILGPHEVLGHLPIVASAIVLFVYNGGRASATQLFGKKRASRSNSYSEEE